MNEPWWNRATNLLIKFLPKHDFIGLYDLPAAFSGNFRTFPHWFRQQTDTGLTGFGESFVEDTPRIHAE